MGLAKFRRKNNPNSRPNIPIPTYLPVPITFYNDDVNHNPPYPTPLPYNHNMLLELYPIKFRP
jgi:hypothetical protein